MGCREGFDALTLGSPSCRTHLSPLLQMRGGGGNGDKRIQMRDISEVDSTGCRVICVRAVVEERFERDSKGIRLGDQRERTPFSSLAIFLPPFPRPTSLGFYFGSCCERSAPWGQELWLHPSPQCLYPSIKVVLVTSCKIRNIGHKSWERP